MSKRGEAIRRVLLALVIIVLTFWGSGISSALAENQEIAISPGNQKRASGDNFTVSVNYDVSNDDNTLTGLDINIHFDSSKLTYISYLNFLGIGDMQISPILTNDTGNADNNPNTDKKITMSWAGFSGQWPNVALPVILAELNFTVNQDAEEGETPITISVSDNASGYGTSLAHGTITIIDVTDDPDNCGTVGNICEYNQAEDLCVNGECSMGACEAGYYNLNNNPADGCEYSCTVTNAGVETCDGIDNNCDGLIDNGNFAQYSGIDEGECQQGIIDCVNGQIQQVQQEIGSVAESCDNKDNDCDGDVDEDLTRQYGATDVGNCEYGTETCQTGAWIITTPSIASITETCDGTDNDCDGDIDEGVSNTYYYDGDGDGYGNAIQTIQACFAPIGYVDHADDCDDSDGQVIEPIPDFGCSTTVGYIPLSVQFSDKSIGNLNYSWNFGDGGVSSEKDPNHTYTKAGTYTVTLAVDIEGTCLAQKSVTIRVLNASQLTGQVLSQDAAVAGAKVQVLGHPEYQAVTEAGGVFTIPGVPLGEHTLWVTASGYETRFERILNLPGKEIEIELNAKVGWICGRVLRSTDDKPIRATVIAFTHEGGFYSGETQSDPNNGTYIIYLSRPGDYSLLASAWGYSPYLDSNQGGKYLINPDNPATFKGNADTFAGGIDMHLVPISQGPKVKVSSFEHDKDPNQGTVDNETVISVLIETEAPLSDPNVIIEVVDGQALDSNEVIIGGKKHYQALYSDDLEDTHTVNIRISAMDQNGTTTVTYNFIVHPGTPAPISGGTSDNITFAEGGESGKVGLINLDLDGDGDFDYDGSYIDVPPCGIVAKSSEDPNFALTGLTIRIERLTEKEGEPVTAEYDINLLDQEGNPATGFEVNEERPITIYLHFDADKFDGNLANLVIKYQGTDGTWKTDGISNVRIVGTAIAFDVTHLTRFAVFEENLAPATLTVKAATISRIDLSWQDRTNNELHFEIWRCVNCADQGDISNYTKYAEVNPDITSYSDNGCTKDNTYYYSVRAVNGFGETDFSNKSGLTLNYCAFPPDAPVNLTVAAKSESEVTLLWEVADPANSCINNFKIYRSQDGQTWIEIGDADDNTPTYPDTGLEAQTTYYYQVKAANIKGDSDPGNTVQVTTDPAPTTDPLPKTDESSGACFISTLTGSSLWRYFSNWLTKLVY